MLYAHTDMNVARPRRLSRQDAYQVLAAQLADLHKLPAQQAIEKVNRELARNPLTAGFRIEPPPSDGRVKA